LLLKRYDVFLETNEWQIGEIQEALKEAEANASQ
jgi:hypothetical protein